MVNLELQKISNDKVRTSMKWMKSEMAVGLVNIPVTVRRCTDEKAVDFIPHCLKQSQRVRVMEEKWCAELQKLQKDEVDAEARLRNNSLMLRKRTAYAMFALRMLIEKYREGLVELHCVVLDQNH